MKFCYILIKYNFNFQRKSNFLLDNLKPGIAHSALQLEYELDDRGIVAHFFENAKEFQFPRATRPALRPAILLFKTLNGQFHWE
jgi:hypothetical protein